MGRLTVEQREQLVRDYVAGDSSTLLSRRYKLSGPAVLGLLHRRNVKIRRVTYTVRHDALDDLGADACYWSGFLFADGSVSRRPGYAPSVSVGLARRDVEHLLKLRDFLGSNHAVSLGVSGRHLMCQYSVRSSRLAGRLVELGRYEGPTDPGLLSSRDFWRGLFDGDGSLALCSKNGRLVPWFGLVGRRDVLEGFVAFLAEAGIRKLTVRPHKSICRVSSSAGTAVAVAELLYRNASPALDRKMAKASLIIAKHRNGPTDTVTAALSS
jgi:hypothetical protein